MDTNTPITLTMTKYHKMSFYVYIYTIQLKVGEYCVYMVYRLIQYNENSKHIYTIHHSFSSFSSSDYFIFSLSLINWNFSFFSTCLL